MGIRVYCGADFKRYKHEWNQFIELIETLKIEFQENSDDVYVLGNVYAGRRDWVDGIIITKTGIAIIEFKSEEGEIHGSENGNWYTIDSQGKKKFLRRNVFEQLTENKSLILSSLKGMRKQHFPYITNKQLDFIRCWGYFEPGSSYDINQLVRENRITFNVVSRETLLENIRFLDCSFSFKEETIELIIDKLNLKKCKGLTLDGDNEVLKEIMERFDADEEEYLANLVNWSQKHLEDESLQIRSFTTREKVHYLSLDVAEQENPKKVHLIRNQYKREKALKSIAEESKDFNFLLGIPGSGKSTILKHFYKTSLTEYIKNTKSKFPVLVRLTEIEVGKTIDEYILTYYHEIYNEIQHFQNKGKVIFILDAWDELNPVNKIEVESFLRHILKKNNKTIISSRFLNEEDYPKIEKGSNEFYESSNLIILPIEIKELGSYFLSRLSTLATD